MALTCPIDLSGVSFPFTEFIDCDTISISYEQLGVATVSFSVVASKAEPVDSSVYTTLTFGGVVFTGYITSLEIKRLAGTTVYEHRYTLSMTGCRA